MSAPDAPTGASTGEPDGTSAGALLRPGEPVDLDNCAREPIHVPGMIQPRGALVVVREDDGTVVQVSDNLATHLGRTPAEAIGRPLADLLGAPQAEALLTHVRDPRPLAPRNPLLLHHRDASGVVRLLDGALHRPPLPVEPPGSGDVPVLPVVVLEVEPASAARPLDFPNTYQAVRDALAALDRATTLVEVVDAAARHVRSLTGFDRVMIYRFDDDYNGEVVAEARREDLNPFLGLHYPASDIPPQARALYEKNWIRLIADVGYTPSPVVPTDLPTTGQPLDLTFSTLRSVSPIHLEYLANMGVRASMSISLLHEGRLWGLIACHHYSGPHEPPFEVRTAAEFLGATLSVRVVAQAEDERDARHRAAAGVLAGLVAASRDDETPLATALTEGLGLLELVGADGALVVAEGRTANLGTVPGPTARLAVLDWVRATAGPDGVAATDSLRTVDPAVGARAPDVAGVLGVVLPDGQAVVWLRDEVVRRVDWGGDPHNKAIALLEGDTVRLSPRRSFDRWREVVEGHGQPWEPEEVESAAALRTHVVEALYVRGRRDVRATEALQRSLLPVALPSVPGWSVEARYDAAGTGLVGGDWYDVLPLPTGEVAVVVGDVTGHGLEAAATMGQLRATLRGALLEQPDAGAAIGRLARAMRWLFPGRVASVLVAILDPATGAVRHASAGHPPLVVVAPDGSVAWGGRPSAPPLGIVERLPEERRAQVPPGGALVLYSDGLVERRDESLRDGLLRLGGVLAEPAGVPEPDVVVRRTRDAASTDDATLVVLRRGLPEPAAA